MSRQALLELLLADSTKFNRMQKMMPVSEKSRVLDFFSMRLRQLENLQ